MMIQYIINLLFLIISLKIISTYQSSVLITGGAGFVGRHFTKKYCDFGWDITIVDNLISESSIWPSEKWPKHLQSNNCNIKFYQIDCREYFTLSISQYKFDVFIHLAAIVGGRATIEGNPLAVAEDLAIDSTAFKYAINNKTRPGRMVYFSSSAAYPIRYQLLNDKNFLTESMINLINGTDDIGFPDLTYGWSKLTGEYLGKLAYEKYGLNISIYRPFSGYGEDQHESYPFISILNQIIKKNNPISIWSNSVRDFVYIDDIIECVLNSMDKINGYEPINIGSGKAVSFSELAYIISDQVGYNNPKIVITDGMPTGPLYRVANISKYHSIGCSNKISLKEGVGKAIKYIESTLNHVNVTKKNARHHFSSMKCTAGSQYIPCKRLQKTQNEFPHANSLTRRVCKFENICRINGTFYFYSDTKSVPLASFNGKLLRLGYKSHNEWSPVISLSSIPDGIPFSNLTYNLLYETSYSENFGHFLIDDMLPQFFAIDLWDIPTDDFQLIASKFCDLSDATSAGTFDKSSPLNPNTTRKQTCINKYNTLYKYIFDAPIQILEETKDLCFKNLIAGHAHTFSLNSLELARAGFLKRFRNTIVERSGLSYLLLRKSSSHKILVLTKDRGWDAADKFLQANLCNTVKQHVASISPIVEVSCFANVSDISFQDQLKMSLESTIIITEHGTLSYASIFVRDGVVAIVLANDNDKFKEPQILLHMSHAQVYYLSTDKINTDFFPMILFSLTQVSKTLNMEVPTTLNYPSTDFDFSIDTKTITSENMTVEYLQADGSFYSEYITISGDTDPFEIAFDYCAIKKLNKIECTDIYRRVRDIHQKLSDDC